MTEQSLPSSRLSDSSDVPERPAIVLGDADGPQSEDEIAAINERASVATPSQLMWWKFRRHKIAVLATVLLALAYIVAIFAEFFSPYTPGARTDYFFAPPQLPRFVDAEGNFHLRPFVYGLNQSRDLTTLMFVYEPNTEEKYFLRFFVEGEPYKLFGLINANRHLFGVDEGGVIFLLGADNLGRDMFSRITYGARISLSIGLVGVFLSITLGMLLGGLSGLRGGAVDNVIQRIIETLIAIPAIPLWMGLSAAIPPTWPPVRVYFGITVILSLLGWTSIARIARGKFLATREQDFVIAATVYGCSTWRVIVSHLIPTFFSFVIVRITLDIPRIILAETALSFLGIGLRPPVVSWGVLLQSAQSFQTISLYPWLWMGPAAAVVLVVLAFNFLGDGLRDAADPFAK